MTAARPERPDLATIICVFEFLAGVVPLASLVLLVVVRGQMLARHPGIAPHPISAMLGFASIGYAALTFAATIALWQMRRISFYLFAVKLAINLYQYLRLLFHAPAAVILHSNRPPVMTPDQIRTIGLLIALVGVILLAAITWYVYVVTQPKVLSDDSHELA